MNFWDYFTIVTTASGLFFFIAGTLGLLRFPDVFSRLHALTKADNLGLGLIAIGAAPQLASIWGVLQLGVIWVFAMISGAVASFLVASYQFTQVSEPSTVKTHDRPRERDDY